MYRATNALGVYLGNGDGTFQLGAVLATGVTPLWVVAANLNADGAIDLAVANYGSNSKNFVRVPQGTCVGIRRPC